MENIILCPRCESLAYFNLYFGEYKCSKCRWKDDSYNKDRIRKYKELQRSNK